MSWRRLDLLLALALAGCGEDSGGGSAGGGSAGIAGAATGGAAGGGGASGLELGLLQLRVAHNLEVEGCVQAGNCALDVDVDSDTPGFLQKVAAASSMPVLHWDYPMPWPAFDEDPPAGGDRVAFYDAKVPAEILARLDAFAAHFAQIGGGYLAVTPLNGMRNRLKPMWLDATSELEIGSVCPTLTPGTKVSIDLTSQGGAVVEVDVARAFRNFTLYLHDKLQPSYLALAIEANLFKAACPSQWPSLVALYHASYDALRAQIPSQVRVFATLTLNELLGYSAEACYGDYDFQACPASGSNYPASPDPAKCYPLDQQVLTDLDQGNRLDVLALSVYPDGLGMARAGLEDATVDLFDLASNAEGPCWMSAKLGPWVDPLAQLPRLGWTKPVAIAETGARSCVIHAWLEDPSGSFLVRVPGNESAEAEWTEHLLTTAQANGYLFVNGAFYAEYPPIGAWAASAAVIPSALFNVFNAFPCMGLYDASGAPKAAAIAAWQAALPK